MNDNEKTTPSQGPPVSPEDSPGPEAQAELQRRVDVEMTPEEDPETYPLRDASEDPRWAVKTVWIWMGFALLSLTFILVLIILGVFFE